jgi:polysaccharide export outer membrane protein
MRTAIFSALLATALVVCLAAQTTQPPQQQDQKQDARKPSPQPESISPLIPVPAPAGAAAPPDTDPSRMAAPSGAVGAVGAKPIAGVDTKSYVIGAEDVLSIIVFENVGFNVPSEMVRPDGKITMPLIGELQASGKTPEQLKAEITEVLATNYMNLPPHVSVIVVQVNSKNYYLNGEVLKPGKYPLIVPTTVMQALVNAGGFKDFANKKKIRIQRGTKFFQFNYNEVSKGKKLDQNILLQPDDQIFVN